jgi:alkylated DNA nucleotide flippase Atl1
MTETRTIGEMGLESQQIAKLLVAMSDGDILTYADIRKQVGVDIREKRYVLNTARKHAEEQTGRLFATVNKEGVKRLHPDASHSEMTRARQHINRHARKQFRRSEKIDYQALSKDARDALNLERTVLHFVGEASSTKSVKKLAAPVASAADAMTFGKTLEMFGK